MAVNPFMVWSSPWDRHFCTLCSQKRGSASFVPVTLRTTVLVVTHVGGSQCVGRVVSSICDCVCVCALKRTSPQSNLRRTRRKGLIGYNGTSQIHPKTAPSHSTITTPSNTPIPCPTPLTTPNGIRIQSAVLPQCTFRTHTQMVYATGP